MKFIRNLALILSLLNSVPIEAKNSFFKEVHFAQTHRILNIHSPGEELDLQPQSILSKPMEFLYIADSKRNRIYKTETDGELISILNPPSGLKHPAAMTFLNSKEFAVLDGAGHRILIFNEFDDEIGKISSPGTGKSQLLYPKDFLFEERSNSFLIADYGNLRILELDRSGKFQRVFLYVNQKTLEKGAPISIALSGENLFALYPDYNHLVIFDRFTGDVKEIISNSTLGERLLLSPSEISAGPGGFVFLSDPVLKAILVFNSDGELEDRLQLPWRPFLGIERPGALQIDPAGSLYVVDQKDEKIHRLAARKEYQFLFGADLQFQQGKNSEALKLYEEVLSINPQNSKASDRIISILQTRSEEELSSKNYDSSLDTLNRILRLEPSNRNALTMKRIVLWHRNKEWIGNLGLSLLSILVFGLLISMLMDRRKPKAPQEAS